MSYNISCWKTKVLKNLRIPISKIENLEDVTIDSLEENRISIECLSEGEINGVCKEGFVSVIEITYFGEGSGSGWEDFKELLTNSDGELIASQVWEGGDLITLLTVKDGSVKEEEIDL